VDPLSTVDIIEEAELRYLKLLSRQFPNISSVSTEIVNLSAIVNLPKGTEHFLADIHGEHEAFDHVMRNASGVVKRKIDDVFAQTLSEDEKKSLATLVYYPKDKIRRVKDLYQGDALNGWYAQSIYQLVRLCRAAGYKYTRSKVRKAIPENFKYIIEELLHENEQEVMKQAYYKAIIDQVIAIRSADAFIEAMSRLIRRLVVDQLHIIGDIYDRGNGAQRVMDILMRHHAVDIQWGNHDVLWIGAACGIDVCIADALRIALRYGNLETIEVGYGINLSPLVRLAMEFYPCEPGVQFSVRGKALNFNQRDLDLMARMQKAIAVIQFKLEGQMILRNPQFKMGHRMLLNRVDFVNGTLEDDGVVFTLNDVDFPTVDEQDPYQLTEREAEVMAKLKISFTQSQALQEHIRFLVDKGSMYKVHNGNLLYHGCIPLTDTGTFKALELEDKNLSGIALLDFFDEQVRMAFYHKQLEHRQKAMDWVWYLWCGSLSPLFGKEKMATFERYFIDDPRAHKEPKNAYFELREDESICSAILSEFGLKPEDSRIINGHVPVKVKKGELPVKAGGRLITIDGGFSKAYQKETGIAGFTLIYNSQGMALVAHEPFSSREQAVALNLDMVPTTVYFEMDRPQVFVGDTDVGHQLKLEIEALSKLLSCYQTGLLPQG